jgi:hypothetical protein
MRQKNEKEEKEEKERKSKNSGFVWFCISITQTPVYVVFRYDFASYKVQRFFAAVLRDEDTESGAEIRPGQHEHLLGFGTKLLIF